MKKHLILTNEKIQARAALLVEGISPDTEVHEVIIRPYKVNRSAAQNSLMWKWLTIIGDDLGNSKDEQHLIYKEQFLVPIFTRDSEDYAAMVQAVKDVRKKAMTATANALKKQIVKLTSTTDASVKQMTEYLTDIDRHAASLSIPLPRPDDGKL